MSIKKILKTGIVTLVSILIFGVIGTESSRSVAGIALAQTYQPPENVTVTMYRLLSDGSRSTERCDLIRNGQYVNLYSWGCTAYCEDVTTQCNTSQQLPYPMSAEPATLAIDGSAGSPGAIYNQYLRDVVPLEIAIKFGSQGFKLRSAVEAQAIAARTYIYDRIRNVATYGAINNSNQFQVFVPYYYDSLTSLQKIIVQIATNNPHYLSESSNANPIEALFGADNPGFTSEGNRSYLKSVADPISQPYGVIDGTTLGGMSSKGASRWSFGHTSSKGPVSPTDSHFPHDVDGDGNFWSVQYDSAARILTHYYTGVHIRDNTTAVVSPDNRWTPLQITWAGVCPSLMLHDEDCTASVQVQNIGVSDWDCSMTVSYALRY